MLREFYKRKREQLLRLVAVTLERISMRTALASYSADIPRCIIILHQPDIPKELMNLKESNKAL